MALKDMNGLDKMHPTEVPETEISKKRKPQSDEHRKRSEVLKLRLTTDEKEKMRLAAAACGMTVTDYILACQNQTPIVVIDGLPELTRELRKQGTNLNQLAKVANSYQDTRALVEQIETAAAETARVRTMVMDYFRAWDATILTVKEEHHDGHHETGSQ